VQSPITVGDMTIKGDERLTVTTETHAPKLLDLLWDRYGENVEQISRLEIALKIDDDEMQKLMSQVVYDPRVDLNTRIMDGIDRILPEGARVRYPTRSTGRITIIASENPIKEEWKEKAKAMLSKMTKGDS